LVWLKSNWRWSALNLFAGCISAYLLSQGSTGWSNMDTFDSGLESGKWAIRFLLACLTMTPLNTYFGWKGGIKLRKSAGLWAFAFASLHVLLYIRDAKLKWLTFSMPLFLTLGLVGMSILSVLASTSNRWAMQRLGKNWKRLHRLVYILGIAVVTHSMLATMMSKKIFVRDPQAPNELKAYVAILSVLLVVRIPLVRQLLKQIPVLLKRRRKLVSPVAIPGDGVELWPKIHGRESSTSLQPTFIIPNEISEYCESNHIGHPPQELKRIADSREAVRSTEIRPEREA
jgi:methionine sulfoxide reductase heme-binding subunit